MDDSEVMNGANLRKLDRIYPLARTLQIVPRWGIVPTIRRQTVDAHSFHVATVALALAARHRSVHEGNALLGPLLIEALIHDASESISGDLPSPFKRLIGSDIINAALRRFKVSKVSDTVANILKCADCIEAMLFLREDMMLGNNVVGPVYTDISVNFKPHWSKFDWNVDECGDKPDYKEIVDTVAVLFGIGTHPGLNP